MYNVIDSSGEIINSYDNKGKAVNAAFAYLTADAGCSGMDLSMVNDKDIVRIFVGNTDSGVKVICA